LGVDFCMGGALVIASSYNFPDLIDASSCYYGIPDTKDFDFKKFKMPFHLHFGKEDSMKGFSDIDSAQNLQKKFKENGVNSELFLYDGVGHAFMNFSRPETYNKQCYETALERDSAFFKKVLHH